MHAHARIRRARTRKGGHAGVVLRACSAHKYYIIKNIICL